MSLTILNVAFPMAPVGPDAVGGAEQVLSQLDSGLHDLGHRSLVVACEGSVTKGKLLPTPRWTAPEMDRRRAAEVHRKTIDRALTSYPVDLVHLHGIDFYEYTPPEGVPLLVTLHLPPDWYPAQAFELERPQTYYHCVSASQRSACATSARLLPEIENGIPDDLLASRHAKRQFAICLGRICPEKGFHLAIDAAKRAGVSLLIAGEVFPYQAHQRYFEHEIVPRLDERRRFIGPIGWKRKRRLISAALCLLVPSLVAETSSLVTMEAMACGTAVIAFRAGALPDLIEPGKTGFLVDNVQEMAEAIRLSRSINSEDCRDVARKRFSIHRMIQRYLTLYHLIVRRAPDLEHYPPDEPFDPIEEEVAHR